MKTYFVTSYGYDCPPEFATLKEARAFLGNSVAAALQSARRNSKQATKHKMGEDCYWVTLGRDSRSALWTAISIKTA